MENEPKNKIVMTRGGRNLIMLGIISVVVAVMTTGVSLAIYHNSGDIYLDRSRPGYLPEEDELDNNTKQEDYEFSKSGKITITDTEEYVEHLKAELERIDILDKAFDDGALSSENLGITENVIIDETELEIHEAELEVIGE